MGQPTVRNGAVRIPESIGYTGHTRGTETSQYPEEKKATAISQVAASETEIAQTGKLAYRGCRTLHVESQRNSLDESSGKSSHRR